MSEQNLQPAKQHLLTVLLEDYFHVRAFNQFIQQRQWYRFETRFAENTRKTLDLLDNYNVKATFFVLGWIADEQPEIVREVAARGHEIASRGYYHRSLREMTPGEFREDLARAKEALTKASGGQKIIGYRAAKRLNLPGDLWALDVLADEGYAYDASVMPGLRAAQSDEQYRFAFQHRSGDKHIWEFPYSTAKIGSCLVPIAGGNYFRQFPHTFVRRAVRRWHRQVAAPFVMYFHVWELDPEQPRLTVNSPLQRIRHYRKLDKMEWVLKEYLAAYPFTSGANYLGIDIAARRAEAVAAPVKNSRALPVQIGELPEPLAAQTAKPSVSIVIPCFNEESVLAYLANTLRSVSAKLKNTYDLHFIFVDDSSTDETLNCLHKLFGAQPNTRILRHAQNQGVAAAILTGLRAAETEIVCSMDCDCTYDPHELENMIPLLRENVALVTASPYHPRGAVRNVPAWRLKLSQGASVMYRRLLRQPLHTFTSCFRVYRRSAVQHLELTESGFLGVAEMLGKLLMRGETVIEYPAVLEVRLFGQSKMKTARTIGGHLRLMARLARERKRIEKTKRQAEMLAPIAPGKSGADVI